MFEDYFLFELDHFTIRTSSTTEMRQRRVIEFFLVQSETNWNKSSLNLIVFRRQLQSHIRITTAKWCADIYDNPRIGEAHVTQEKSEAKELRVGGSKTFHTPLTQSSIKTFRMVISAVLFYRLVRRFSRICFVFFSSNEKNRKSQVEEKTCERDSFQC